MNKYQEALEKIRLLDCYDEENFEIKFENIPILQELVDRAIPKKPISVRTNNFGMGETIGNCHNCNRLVSQFEKYCADCGQAQDWSKDE